MRTVAGPPGSAIPTYPERSALDPQSQAVVNAARASPAAKWWTQSMAQNRADYVAMIEPLSLPAQGLATREIRVIEGPGGPLPLWIYRPRDGSGGPRPIVVFYRGSGMCMGSMQLYKGVCELLCVSSGAVLVAPDYRLAPEHRFPAGHDDSYAALEWASANAEEQGADPKRLVVAGDSAGGMLAAAVTALARDRNGPRIGLQVLICPALGTRETSRSVQLFGEGFLLDRDDLAWLYDQYVDRPDRILDPRVSPIYLKNFTGLPSTFMVTAGSDIMRDDAENYLRDLAGAGVEVELHRFETTVHPFINMAASIEAGRRVLEECGAKIGGYTNH